jgi:hypothetical protein
MDISVNLTSARGERHGIPKLVLDLAVESQTDTPLAIINVTAEIRVSQEIILHDLRKSYFIGPGFLEYGGGQLYPNSKASWQIGIPLTPYQLQKIEEMRKGNDLLLQVQFRCSAGKRVTSPPPPMIADIVQPIMGVPGYSDGYCPFKVAQSDWVKILGELGYGDYFLMEIPLKGVPEKRRMQKALEHLKAAWEHFEQGNDDETLGSCYKAFEYLAKKKKCKDPDQNAFEKILENIPEVEKRRRLKLLMHDLCKFLSLGRHEPGTEKVILDERESEYAIILSQATLGYLAKVMLEAEESSSAGIGLKSSGRKGNHPAHGGN